MKKSLRDRDLVKVDLGYVAIRAPISGTMVEIKRGISESDEVLLLPPGGVATNQPTKSGQ
jgi:hypothetical protein